MNDHATEPDFALSRTEQRVTLLHRGDDGWQLLGEADRDAPDFGAAMAELRQQAEALAGGAPDCKIIISDKDIHYLDVDTGEVDFGSRIRAVRRKLRRMMPDGLQGLRYDIATEGPRTQVAAVTEATLQEAADFAREHGFRPLRFVAAWNGDGFAEEPFFGMAEPEPDALADDAPAPPPPADADAGAIPPKASEAMGDPGTDADSAPMGETSGPRAPAPLSAGQSRAPLPRRSSAARPAADGEGSSLYRSPVMAAALVLLLLVGGFLIFFLQDDSVPDRRIAREDSLGTTGDGPDDLDELTETDAAVLDAMRKDRETGADTGETAPDDATGTDTAATAAHESGGTAAGPSLTTEDSAGETGAPGDEAPTDLARLSDPATPRAAPDELPAAALAPDGTAAGRDGTLLPAPLTRPGEALPDDDGNGAVSATPDAETATNETDEASEEEPTPDNVASEDRFFVSGLASSLSASGVRIYEGRPPVVPPAPPGRDGENSAEDPAESPAETQQASDRAATQIPSATPTVRPRLRAGDSTAPDSDTAEIATAGSPEASRAEAARPADMPRPALRPESVGSQVSRMLAEGLVDDDGAADAPETVQTASLSDSAQAVAQSRAPNARPETLVTAAAGAAATAAPAQAAAQSAPAPAPAPAPTPAPAAVEQSTPSSGSVTQQATLGKTLNLRQMNLIGVYGSANNRRALVRLSNGRYQKLKVGDSLDGGRVIAIGENNVHYQKGGNSYTLVMPAS